MSRLGTPGGVAVLIGFMGAGKTSVGMAVARRLGAEFVDVDARIEERAGRTVSEIFESEGEDDFRRREKEAIREAVSVPRRVIATGGGAFLDPESRALLKAYAPVVFLDASPASVLRRLAGNRTRPLLRGPGLKERVGELMARRRPAYETADHIVDTEGLAVAQVVERVIGLLAGGRGGVP